MDAKRFFNSLALLMMAAMIVLPIRKSIFISMNASS